MTDRPDIEKCRTGAEFSNWYWLKEELIAYCRAKKIPYAGSKQAITDRIAHFIDTGEIRAEQVTKPKSAFDWHKEELTLETVITDSYKNSQNVRHFMKKHYGADFSFNIAFMDWMRANVGKTLAEAVVARREIAERAKTEKSDIPASNQYNQYSRDFFEANPTLTRADARACWAYKRSIPGHNRYEKADLQALPARNDL